MNAGKLRHRVTIQRMTETQNDYGETIQAWTDFAVADAAISPLSAREFMQAQQVKSDITHRVVLRYLSGVRPTMRILFGSRAFHIESVLNIDERNVELQLLCKETL